MAAAWSEPKTTRVLTGISNFFSISARLIYILFPYLYTNTEANPKDKHGINYEIQTYEYKESLKCGTFIWHILPRKLYFWHKFECIISQNLVVIFPYPFPVHGKL